MKTKITIKKLMSLAFGLLIHLVSSAVNHTYTLSAKNIQYASPNVLEFDIYLLNTNYSTAGTFGCSLGELSFNFNNAIFAGNTAAACALIYGKGLGAPSIVTTLGSPSYIKIPSTGSPFPVAPTGDGTMLGRFRMTKTTGDFNQNVPLNLAWKNAIIYQYGQGALVNITNPAGHKIVKNIMYKVTAKNPTFTNQNKMQFDIYLLHTNYAVTPFYYGSIQCAWSFNNAIFYPEKPVSASVKFLNNAGLLGTPGMALGSDDGQYYLYTLPNNLPSTLVAVSHTGEGTYLGTFELTNESRYFPSSTLGLFDYSQDIKLAWKNIGNNTKLFAGPSKVEVTKASNFFVTYTWKSLSPFPNEESVNNIETDDNKLTVYPNPTSDLVNFSFNLKDELIKTISVVDILGKSIMNIDGSTMIQNQIILDSSIPAGTYFLRLDTDKGQHMTKFNVAK